MESPVQPFVQRASELTEYYFKEGCHITEWLNHPDDPAASIARVRVVSGDTTRWHSLDGIAERYVILEGAARVEVGTLPAASVAAGDVVVIPAGVRQRITNTGHDDLIFLAVCTPKFCEDAYRDLQETS